jgi:hypothetical protein
MHLPAMPIPPNTSWPWRMGVLGANPRKPHSLAFNDLRAQPEACLHALFKLDRGVGLSNIRAERAGLEVAQAVPGLACPAWPCCRQARCRPTRKSCWTDPPL